MERLAPVVRAQSYELLFWAACSAGLVWKRAAHKHDLMAPLRHGFRKIGETHTGYVRNVRVRVVNEDQAHQAVALRRVASTLIF